MRKEDASRDMPFEKGFEAIDWLLTAVLALLAVWLPPSVDADRAHLLVLVSVMAAANVVLHRLMPASSDGVLRYRREDKALVASCAAVFLLTLYLYQIPKAPVGMGFLYLLPLFGATLVLHERVVLGEALLSIVALLFLRAASWVDGPFLALDLGLQLVVFVVASCCLMAVTYGLRTAFDRAQRLSAELSRRLDQIQVIEVLARQSELTADIERLARRTGEIVSDAVDTETHAVFVCGGRDAETLRLVGASGRIDEYDRELLTVDENLRVLRGVLETGVGRILDGEDAAFGRLIGNAHIRNMLVMPLRVREEPVGVLCLMNRRDGSFHEEDVHYCGLLAGFVATLLNGAVLFERTETERRTVERMAKLMIGRELKMREMKGLLRGETPDKV